MRERELIVVAMLGLCSFTGGCALVESGQDAARQTFRIFKFQPNDYRDFSEEQDDKWSFVGEDARGGMKRTRDPDQWFKQHFMSEKARNVERNLGID